MQTVIYSAGFGGQGVMVMGQLLGLAACLDGKEATFYPLYGPEQRGGTASCTTIISDERIGAPTTVYCDVLIALNTPSLLKFQDSVKPQGLIVTDPLTAANSALRKDVTTLAVPAEKMAADLGSAKAANLALIAIIARRLGILSKEALEKAVVEKLGKKKALLEINLATIQAGWEYAISCEKAGD